MTKKKIDHKNFVIHSLRRASYRWYARTAAMNKARVERGVYECSICKGRFGRKEIQVDHIEPVIDPAQGYIGLNTFTSRLLCDEDGFQIICKPCHKTKSGIENVCRNEIKFAIKKMRKALAELQGKEHKDEDEL